MLSTLLHNDNSKNNDDDDDDDDNNNDNNNDDDDDDDDNNNGIFIILESIIQSYLGVRCSSMVRVFIHGAMSCQINPSWSRPIELFLVPASAPRLWYVLSCLWDDDAYKRTLAAHWKE